MSQQQTLEFVQVININQIRKMGGKESTPGNQQKDQIPKVNNPRFQNIKFARNQDGEDCIQVKLPVANIKEYEQWATSLKDAPAESENYLLPIKHQFKKEGFCGSSGFVNILFENFPYVLADQIRNRACLKQKFFDEPQLWYLIYTLISAGHQFHKNGKKVGDVRPQNVFINEDGQVKVATQLTWPSQNTNYYKTFYEKQPTYLAPQQLRDIQFAKMQPSCNSKLAESFSIGLTCLDAGTLSSSNNLFLKGNKFDYEQLNKKLQELSNAGYSQILCLVVSNLCQTDSDRRSTCSELFSWLEPYQEHIINLQRFQVSNLPEKLSYSGGVEQSNSQTQSGINTANNIPTQQPQVLTYVNPPIQSNYVNMQVQQQNKLDQYHYPIQNQGYIQGTHIYQQPPLQIQIPQINQPTAVQITQQSQLQSKPTPQRTVQQFQPIIQGPSSQISQNKITTSTYSFSQYGGPGPVQYNSSIPSSITTTNVGLPYANQNIQFQRLPQSNFQINEVGVQKQKSTMDLTLEKIDEQLQMSRKMFPS